MQAFGSIWISLSTTDSPRTLAVSSPQFNPECAHYVALRKLFNLSGFGFVVEYPLEKMVHTDYYPALLHWVAIPVQHKDGPELAYFSLQN